MNSQNLKKSLPRALQILIAAIIFALGPSGLASALTQDDIYSVLSGTAYYDPNDAGNCTDTGGLSTSQIASVGLPSAVPEPYRTIISAAAAKFGADPNIVAAIFAQENGARWPDPNESWPTNPSSGATGPMQFLPSTWAGEKVDGNGDGVADISNLYDALYTGAKYIAGFGGVPGTPVGTLQKPLMTNTMLRVAASYNWGGGYVDRSGPDFPLNSLYPETKTYVENVYAMLTSNFANLKSTVSGNQQAPPSSSGECTYTSGGSCSQGSVRQRVINCAEQELSLWSSGQLKPGDDFKKYTNGRPEDWCADFASWIYNQAGYPFGPAGSYGNDSDIAYTGNFVVPPQDGNKFIVHDAAGYTPQPGDVALHSQSGNPWYHTNLVDKVNGSTITLIGGNQSAVDGGGEYFTRSKVSTYPINGSMDDNIVYYISPAKDDTTSGSSASSVTIDNAAAQAAAKSSGATVGYALYDSTGKLLASYNNHSLNYGASITKSILLVAYLTQLGAKDITSDANSNLTAMIENSDNGAANWVYSHLSNPAVAVRSVASNAGMKDFILNTSDPLYVLGQSKVSADDFAKFFSKIDTLMPTAHKNFGLNLLANLSPADQNGLLKSGLPGTVYSKEGWKSEPAGTAGAPYVVNQAAQFSTGGTTYGVAVTIGGTANRASGEAIVQKVVSSLIKGG